MIEPGKQAHDRTDAGEELKRLAAAWMIYGANGYTGELIAREAVRQGMRPILAGRTVKPVDALAGALGLDARTFSLDRPDAIRGGLAGVSLVLNCAGPFSATAGAMMERCLRAKAHYLDITGEIAVFEQAQRLDSAARSAGIVICPGVGFDVIPTDCIAATLKAAMPDANHLALGFDSRSSLSPGTAKTSVESLAAGGKIRRDGSVVTVPHAYRTRTIDFGGGEKHSMTIPWGDVSTAYATTGIPNIEVYVPVSPSLARCAKWLSPVRSLAGIGLVQRYLKRRIEQSVKGPSAEARDAAMTYVWGEARNARGDVRTARLRTANGYSVTVSGALAVVDHVLRTSPPAGTYTPSRLVGADLASRLPGSSKIVIV